MWGPLADYIPVPLIVRLQLKGFLDINREWQNEVLEVWFCHSCKHLAQICQFGFFVVSSTLVTPSRCICDAFKYSICHRFRPLQNCKLKKNLFVAVSLGFLKFKLTICKGDLLTDVVNLSVQTHQRGKSYSSLIAATGCRSDGKWFRQSGTSQSCNCICIFVCVTHIVYLYICLHVYLHLHLQLYLHLCLRVLSNNCQTILQSIDDATGWWSLVS